MSGTHHTKKVPFNMQGFFLEGRGIPGFLNRKRGPGSGLLIMTNRWIFFMGPLFDRLSNRANHLYLFIFSLTNGR